MRDEMCLTDDLYAGCSAVITPAERNYCYKQKLASHKCICIHLIWRQASQCQLWQQAISLSARKAFDCRPWKNSEKWAKRWKRCDKACHLVWRQSSAAPWWPLCQHRVICSKCCVTCNIAGEKQGEEMTRALRRGTQWLWPVLWE